MAESSDVRLIEVRRGGALIGLLPLEVALGYARLPVAIVQNWCHHHMFLGTPLVAAGEERAFWSATLALLDEADWAPNLLHLRDFVEGGPIHLGLAAVRPTATVHREIRALLDSDLTPEAYYEQAVRQKKRKEIRRLKNRLAELGDVRCHALADRAELGAWCDAYLAMEAAGWKGKAGTALAGAPKTARFFSDAVAAAFDAGRLQFLRLDLAGAPIAMLVNFLTAPGSFSFKTVFDEAYARFSPGVLIQLENLQILNDPAIDWMDSCASEDHPMIDALWTERRAIVRVTVRLAGARRGVVFAICRALEKASALVRGRL
jgi:CelD/BcsL family acetyltransferase involved in cellulose biosynthesis